MVYRLSQNLYFLIKALPILQGLAKHGLQKVSDGLPIRYFLGKQDVWFAKLLKFGKPLDIFPPIFSMTHFRFKDIYLYLPTFSYNIHD